MTPDLEPIDREIISEWKRTLMANVETKKKKTNFFYTIILILGGLFLFYLFLPWLEAIMFYLVFMFRWTVGV